MNASNADCFGKGTFSGMLENGNVVRSLRLAEDSNQIPASLKSHFDSGLHQDDSCSQLANGEVIGIVGRSGESSQMESEAT
jgi:hypothetical protein